MDPRPDPSPAEARFPGPDPRGDAATGIEGLDDVLAGGFERGRLFVVEGSPGAGKTTIAMQFLIEGARRGERPLYITLSETEAELRASADAHGWSLDGIDIEELLPPESLLDERQQQSLLYSSDLELGETTRRMAEIYAARAPDRVVIDSLSEILLLAQSPLRYRRQVLALKQSLVQGGATVLMLDDLTMGADDRTTHSLAHGVLHLENRAPEYGAGRRRMRVIKYRGRRVRGGFHDFVIDRGGVRAFPRLVSAEYRGSFVRGLAATGNAGLDALTGGGLERGSSVLLMGPAGTGKSLLALTYLAAAVERGEKGALFVFDEELGLLRHRALGLGLDLAAMVASGALRVEQVDAAELSPGEFSHRVRDAHEGFGATTVVIDSLNGYQQAMPEEQALVLHIHELLQYLCRRGATTFLTIAQIGLVGDMRSPVDVTYLADTLILLRYFEATGRVRRAVSVVKKRAGAHEDTIREFRIGPDGFRLGEPLTGFQGVLRGVPELLAGLGQGPSEGAA